jgi:sugar lactone lactonase YvrE
LGQQIAAIPEPAHNRTNDGTVDALGRLWLGTMDDDERLATGAVWCLDRGVLHRAGGGAVVTNGPAVSPDGQFLYWADSGERTIHRHRLGPEPILGPGEVFLRLGEDEGFPDGIVVDSEDCLWVALWDGWGVRRYAPDGRLLLHVPLPCARVTKLAFGGPDLATAYVTTARVGLDEEALAQQPLAGSLFSFAAPAAGVALPPVRLER